MGGVAEQSGAALAVVSWGRMVLNGAVNVTRRRFLGGSAVASSAAIVAGFGFESGLPRRRSPRAISTRSGGRSTAGRLASMFTVGLETAWWRKAASICWARP